MAVVWPDLFFSSQPMPLPEVIVTGDAGELNMNSATCDGLPTFLVGLAALPGFPIEEFCKALNRRDFDQEVVFWR